MAEFKGIDVSKWQGEIDWHKVANTGIKFAIIRLGYRGYGDGSLKLDPFFRLNVQGAAANNIPYGVYFFSQAVNASEGAEEARYVMSQLETLTAKPLYPIYFDAEYSNENQTGRTDGISKAARTAAADAFCNTLELAGYYAGVYTYTSFALEGKIDYPALAAKYTMWLADYRTNYDKTLKRDIHQYSSAGKVDGINGPADMNLSAVDFPAIVKKAGLNGWPKTGTAETIKPTTVSIEAYNALQAKYTALQSEHKKLLQGIENLLKELGG